MNKVQKDYRNAEEKLATVLRIKKEVQTKVLASNKFTTTEGEEANLLNDYMMTGDVYVKYLKLCFEGYEKAGLNPIHFNRVVERSEELRLRKALDDLMTWGKAIMSTLPAYRKNEKDLERVFLAINYNPAIKKSVIKLTMALK